MKQARQISIEVFERLKTILPAKADTPNFRVPLPPPYPKQVIRIKEDGRCPVIAPVVYEYVLFNRERDVETGEYCWVLEGEIIV